MHVDGDRAAYERQLAALPGVEQWTTEADGDGGFYVYVRTALREEEASYRDALDRDSVLVVPPVELRDDRTVRQTMVGESEGLTAALEGLSEGIEVEVLRTGTYGREDGAVLSDRQREALGAAWARWPTGWTVPHRPPRPSCGGPSAGSSPRRLASRRSRPGRGRAEEQCFYPVGRNRAVCSGPS